MNDEFCLRSGKYTGKSIGWLKKNNPNYLGWVAENRPEMLKELKVKKIQKVEPKMVEVTIPKAIQPNLNFWNEGPSEMSKIYLDKIKNNNKL